MGGAKFPNRCIGLKNGYEFGAGEGKVSDGQLFELVSATHGDIEQGIFTFCAKPENANLPALYGEIVLCMKIRDSPEVIEIYEANVRKFEQSEAKKWSKHRPTPFGDGHGIWCECEDARSHGSPNPEMSSRISHVRSSSSGVRLNGS